MVLTVTKPSTLSDIGPSAPHKLYLGDGGAGVNGAYQANDGVGNPNLKWETTQTSNVWYRPFILQRPYQR